MQGEPSAAQDSAAETLEAPAGVAVTAAPGVAFNYRYAFSLPAERISAAQEEHAGACEKLGIARCRITGLRYQLVGEGRVVAMLAFKLDPSLARQFGKEGIAAIQKAEGTLVDAEITGTDAGAEINRIAAERARAQEELTRIDRELARPGLSASERTELQQQRAEIAQRIEAGKTSTSEQRESLANTPMVFDYRSGRAVRGFDAGAPLTSSLDLLAASAQATLAFVLGAIAVLGPPLLVLLAGLLAWRWIRPRFRPAKAGETVAPAVASD
ncbi:hypothetical protein DAH55_16715 [Sphingomonas koreensis]|uniref:hypothetical protein n=1 Tax=Sphingomonas koreensis TaxID=93064 RepID=UPI00082E6173|nr:hypothetical protein [Sphingomonas koreensis]PJI88260.1 hypothetical protein BDW16_1525 [Sphingomonas koreensis]RSU57640.1 hypothetical protein DAH56_17090 [Sphingomonas koreensis]RSU65755.1 hypothetical protein DAH55_16715 [Sphingomonas koreensis]